MPVVFRPRVPASLFSAKKTEPAKKQQRQRVAPLPRALFATRDDARRTRAMSSKLLCIYSETNEDAAARMEGQESGEEPDLGRQIHDASRQSVADVSSRLSGQFTLARARFEKQRRGGVTFFVLFEVDGCVDSIEDLGLSDIHVSDEGGGAPLRLRWVKPVRPIGE